MEHTQQTEVSKVSFEEWLAIITKIHPPPVILMISIDEVGKFHLLGASSNAENMDLILNEKEKRNPLAG